MQLIELNGYCNRLDTLTDRLSCNDFYLSDMFYSINNKKVKFIYHIDQENNLFVGGKEGRGNYIQENDELLNYIYQVESIEDIEKFDKIINMIILNKKEI
jgi:hypothetical protein